MSSKIPIFATYLKSELLGTPSSNSLLTSSSNLYKSSSSANTILDYTKFGTTWTENKSVPKGYIWTSMTISSQPPSNTKNISYAQYQTLTFKNNQPNVAAIFYSHNIGKTWTKVNMSNINLNGNILEPLYKWSNLHMSNFNGSSSILSQLVIANDKYLFKSLDYGVTWNLEKNLTDISSIAMSIKDGNNIYISGISQPLNVWRNTVNSQTDKIISSAASDVKNAYDALDNYLFNRSNGIDVQMGGSVLYYYYNIITESANIAYTANGKTLGTKTTNLPITNTNITYINTNLENLKTLLTTNKINLSYVPAVNNNFELRSDWTTDTTSYNNSSVGCSYDGNVVTTVSQTNYPYNNTLVITTTNAGYLTNNDITLSETILKNTKNNHFIELNTPNQRIIKIAMSNVGQYQTIVLSNNDSMKINNVYSENGILYSSDYGVTWQYAKDIKTSSEKTLKKINWTSIALSFSGQNQTATSEPSYINKYGYIYYSTDYGKSWTYSSGKTSAPSKSWTHVSMMTNQIIIDSILTDKNDKFRSTLQEGYIQYAISKDGKIYVSKFYGLYTFIKETNNNVNDTAQLTVAIDDSAATQNTIVN